MKKLLPRTSTNTKGFTLIELLIVVSILAILAVITITVFGGIQKTARDSARMADIDAVANAMEVNFSKTNVGQYDGLAGTMLSNGVVPNDPSDTKLGCGSSTALCIYCVTQGGTVRSAAQCSNSGATKLAPGQPTGGSTNLFWMICANLEIGTNKFYCRGNQQ